ncbi:HET-domain-containing protein, partial [Lepidopterella palustris CBS 459.81]
MNKYRYSKLTSPTNIRLLRLLPKERDPKNIRCELFEYPLQDLSGPFPLYEAISYVWGSKENLQSIIIDDRSFDITRNLFTALRHVRDDKLPRTVWVDAICINQDDTEKERQIGLMAEIYAKASCVIVWLGDAEDDGDPLEAIRLIGEKSTERSVAELSTAELTQQKIPQLLKRRWFQRIWVLQEVAAARHILIKCGSTEIDGHAFCVGLEVVRKALNYPIIPAAFLIYGAVFRSRQISRNHGRLSLDICSLGELVDMYHTHKAEIRHDKIYALLGMCSDHYRLLSEATLEPDYNLEWKILMQRLIMFFIGSKASVHTWNDKEIAVIKSKGSILGKVLKVGSKGGNSQSIEAVFKDTSPRMGTLRDYPVQSSVRWTLRAPAKSIQPGDLICFLEGASEPTIVRLNKEYFTVIMVKAVFPEREKSGDYTIQRSEILQSATFYRDFLLVWDWENFLEQ